MVSRKKESRALPMPSGRKGHGIAMPEPCDLSAVAARRLIGAKRLSPVELLDSCVRRIESVNPVLNAIVNPCLEQAREESKAAEQSVMRGNLLGALHGLPLGVKDLNHVGGLKTTYGSPLFAEFVPGEDEDVVARMRTAGAIVVGKTNVPEHGFDATIDNPLYGTTNNPFDPGLSAGASSSGTAVALATGMTPLAMASDFAGSLRTPASFCGIAAFRPSPGTVAQVRRPFAFSPFDVEGPMGRTEGRLRIASCCCRRWRDRTPAIRFPACRNSSCGNRPTRSTCPASGWRYPKIWDSRPYRAPCAVPFARNSPYFPASSIPAEKGRRK